ncbi:MAG: hypothetical protein JXQ29_09450 [Planctomycetes bacterium]|nr:hypothetical protein [Planctomycetota bacterium]
MNEPRQPSRHALLVVLALGSLWGLSEVALNPALRLAPDLPRSGILVGVGALCLGMALGYGGRARLLPLAVLVPILLKQLAFPLRGMAPVCDANACLAVGLEGLALTGAAVVAAGGQRGRGAALRLGAAAGAAIVLAATAFALLGPRLAPCPYLLSFGTSAGGVARFLTHEGLIWGAAAAVTFPLGAHLGALAGQRAAALAARYRPAMALAGTAVVAAAWLAAAWTIAAIR